MIKKAIAGAFRYCDHETIARDTAGDYPDML